MDLTFQVPMQYCSLYHRTVLPSPVTSTSGLFFHFGSASSFFLELFLHSSLVAYWAPTDLGSSSFSVIFFASSYCSWRSFPHSSVSNKSACNAGDLGLIPGSGETPGEGNGNPWRREWQPTPVFLPGKVRGQRSLVGYIQFMGSQRVGYD